MPASRALPTSGDLISRIDREWELLVNSPRFAREFDRYARDFDSLADLRTGTRVRRQEASAADAMLYGLLTAQHAGCQTAGRVVLQCMVPSLRAVVRRSRRFYPDVHDLCAQAIAALWAAIASYDLRRTSNVAGWLHGAVLTAVVGDHAPHAQGRRASRNPPITEIPTESDALTRLASVQSPQADGASAGVRLGTTGEVLELVAWGVDRGLLDRLDAAILTRLYAPDPDLPEYAELSTTRGAFGQAVARELGISHAALRQRAARGVHRLQAAIRAEIETAAR